MTVKLWTLVILQYAIPDRTTVLTIINTFFSLNKDMRTFRLKFVMDAVCRKKEGVLLAFER